jgi:hypothetical protein
MTFAPVIDEGVSCLSFCLEDEEQLVPYGYIGDYSVTRRKPGAN